MTKQNVGQYRALMGKEISSALDDLGEPWSVEEGRNHLKIVVGNRTALILPRSKKAINKDRSLKNTLAELRRFAEGRSNNRHNRVQHANSV